MRGAALVKVEELVGLLAAQRPTRGCQLVEAPPLVGVRGDVGIEVHAVTVCRVDRSIATIGVTEDDLVTGEAVALDLPPATLGLRIFSRIIDLFVVQLAGGIVMTLAGVLTAIADEAVATGIMLAATVLVVVGYPVAMETLTRGRTVGKFATGLRVVRERGRGAMPPPVPMPPHLAQWAVNADIGKVPDGVAAAVRTFLPAAFSMDPAARARRGEDLLAEVLLCVAPPPPPGNHPEYILAAVVAERRRRDYDRLMREAGLRQRIGADV